ncbi:hypothetical protein DPMN_011826 [Dreissena polymorpha]|uniref:Uncharacterized protein n=1 Tax=Dreissena polymorpha TaxID=45954 RepID=A0A9D4S0E1_DREPO|nr:hypothetical protein DPMN_011826 [Dreissena polymorpha]
MNITLESTVTQGGSQRIYGMTDEPVGSHLNKSSTATEKSTNGLIMNAVITLTEGKALNYFPFETYVGESFSFHDIMPKMERRFGSKILPETRRAKLQQAQQQPGESLEDCDDRVLTLATPAFRDLPDQFGQREAVSKFCQDCIHREARKHTCYE